MALAKCEWPCPRKDEISCLYYQRGKGYKNQNNICLNSYYDIYSIKLLVVPTGNYRIQTPVSSPGMLGGVAVTASSPEDGFPGFEFHPYS